MIKQGHRIILQYDRLLLIGWSYDLLYMNLVTYLDKSKMGDFLGFFFLCTLFNTASSAAPKNQVIAEIFTGYQKDNHLHCV